jgi:hypothetical protein
MEWKHFEPHKTGSTCVVDRDCAFDCPFEIGSITTGRQRVFHRYYVKVIAPDGHEVIGTSEHSLRQALLDVDRQLDQRELVLLAAGTYPEFHESGLSANTGFGYIPTCDFAVHMMDVPPPRLRDGENDLFVEGLIREAIAAMFNSPIIVSNRAT